MGLIAKESGTPMEPIPAGVYVAVCYAVIDLGTIFNEVYAKKARKCLVMWEIPEVRGDFEREGKKVNLPRAISKRYSLTLGDKSTLRKDLESWRGRKFTEAELAGFDLKLLLGQACQLQVVNEIREGRTYASISAIMSLPKGLAKPKPENPTLFFAFEPGVKPVLPAGTPEWVSKIIAGCDEWKTAQAATSPTQAPPAPAPAGNSAANDDDVPF